MAVYSPEFKEQLTHQKVVASTQSTHRRSEPRKRPSCEHIVQVEKAIRSRGSYRDC